jgi:hypothetical protein
VWNGQESGTNGCDLFRRCVALQGCEIKIVCRLRTHTGGIDTYGPTRASSTCPSWRRGSPTGTANRNEQYLSAVSRSANEDGSQVLDTTPAKKQQDVRRGPACCQSEDEEVLGVTP